MQFRLPGKGEQISHAGHMRGLAYRVKSGQLLFNLKISLTAKYIFFFTTAPISVMDVTFHRNLASGSLFFLEALSHFPPSLKMLL